MCPIGASGFQGFGDLECTGDSVLFYLMLPKPHHDPSSILQIGGGFAVSRNISRQFFIPEALVGLRP